MWFNFSMGLSPDWNIFLEFFPCRRLSSVRSPVFKDREPTVRLNARTRSFFVPEINTGLLACMVQDRDGWDQLVIQTFVHLNHNEVIWWCGVTMAMELRAAGPNTRCCVRGWGVNGVKLYLSSSQSESCPSGKTVFTDQMKQEVESQGSQSHNWS